MPHLSSFRVGWENEHLATFLLSRIAFVSAPVKIGDDVGTDVFCTLFQRHEMEGGKEALLPRRSIAVQLKPSSDPVDATKHVEYLAHLEVPYYLGVVSQQTLSLTLYSARFLPALWSYRGRPGRVELAPVERFVRDYRPTIEGGFRVLCYKVVTLRASDVRSDWVQSGNSVRQDAELGLKGIGSRLNKEYIFDFPEDGTIEVYTGSGSIQTFRESVQRRMTEALFNFRHLVHAGIPANDMEMDVYVSFVESLRQFGPLSPYLEQACDTLAEQRRVGAGVEVRIGGATPERQVGFLSDPK